MIILGLDPSQSTGFAWHEPGRIKAEGDNAEDLPGR
jgi:hypothetical protein